MLLLYSFSRYYPDKHSPNLRPMPLLAVVGWLTMKACTTAGGSSLSHKHPLHVLWMCLRYNKLLSQPCMQNSVQVDQTPAWSSWHDVYTDTLSKLPREGVLGRLGLIKAHLKLG